MRNDRRTCISIPDVYLNPLQVVELMKEGQVICKGHG